MKRQAILSGLLLVIGAGAQAADEPRIAVVCAGGDRNKFISLSSIDALLAERSVEIMRLANAGDEAGLAGLVAPDAEFIVNSGDASYLSKGPTGLMSFVRFMRRPNSFQSIRRMHGPVVGDPCRRATVNLLVRSESRGAEYPARWLEFTYEGGVLQSVSGYSATVSEGTLQPTAANES